MHDERDTGVDVRPLERSERDSYSGPTLDVGASAPEEPRRPRIRVVNLTGPLSLRNRLMLIGGLGVAVFFLLPFLLVAGGVLLLALAAGVLWTMFRG